MKSPFNIYQILPGTTAGRIALAVVLLQFIPLVLLYNHAYIRIHDTLEGELVWYDLLGQYKLLLNYNPQQVLEPVMNGLPRYALHTGFSITGLLVTLFGAYWGYLVNYILLHTLAYFGMYQLLNRHFLKEEKDQYICMFVAAAFAWVPFFSVFGATVAGQPWVLMGFLNVLTGKETWRDKVAIFTYPLYASVVWAAPAVIGMAGVIFFGKLIARPKYQNVRPFQIRYFFYLVLLGIIFLAANFQLFSINFLIDGFVSHRKEYNPYLEDPHTISKSISETLSTLFIGHYHVGTMVSVPCLLAILVSFFVPVDRARHRLMLSMLSGIIFICIYQGFYNWLVYFLGNDLPLIHEIKLNRIKVLMPFLWLLLFALALSRLGDKKLVMFFLFAQISVNIASNDEFQHNIRTLFNIRVKPDYRQFMAERQFADIRDYIGKPQKDYRVVSLGMNPSIAQHNGFYTLDGLMALYDLNHKHRFRAIMAGEIEKSEELLRYFDGWGNRCYLFSAELGKDNDAFMISKFDQPKVVHNLQFNAGAFREIGGEYLISAVQIENAAQTGLTLEKIFNDSGSWWTVYLYRV